MEGEQLHCNEGKWFVNKIDFIPHQGLQHEVFSQSADGTFIAIVNGQHGIDVHSYDVEVNELKLVMTLEGHRDAPTCLSFSHSTEPVLLISCARDYVIKWNITECLINQHNGVSIKGKVVMQTPSAGVTNLCWSVEDDVVAICTGCDIIIHDVQSYASVHELRGHTDTVTCAAFCPHYQTTLVSASVDRTFMIWNSASGELLYKSSIISSSPIDQIVMNDFKEEFILAFSDGMIRSYDISAESTFSQLRYVDLDKLLNGVGQVSDDSVAAAALSLIPLSISLDLSETGNLLAHDDIHSVRSVFSSVDLLVILTSSHIVVLNERTEETIAIEKLTDLNVGYISSTSLSVLPSEPDLRLSNTVQCLTRRLFDSKLQLIHVSPLSVYTAKQATECALSVISRMPADPGSPLRSSLMPKQLSKSTGKIKSKAKRIDKKGGRVLDQPVVYKTKIRSSGYATAQSKPKMFHPKVRLLSKGPPLKSDIKRDVVKKIYPNDALPVSKVKGHPVTIDSRSTQISQLKFSLEGQSLAVAAANSEAYTFKLPLSANKSCVYSGHSGVVHSCNWSYSGHLLLTASADKTVKLWQKDMGSSVMTLNKLEGNLDPPSHTDLKKFKVLPGECRSAQFFYLDKFILAACANSVLLYKYHVDVAKDDLKRYENKSKYKLVSQQTVESANHITALSAVNTFYSHLVLVTCSDRSIQVLDMNKSTQSIISQDCHSKPAHHITQNEGSLYSTLPYSTYDLFLTAAVGDGLKLWDLRTQSCVRKFNLHTSKAFPCTCEFSPDGKYIATGSEDNSFYVYDIGSGKVVSRVKDPSAVCTNVAFHPLYSQLAACTISGSICLYES